MLFYIKIMKIKKSYWMLMLFFSSVIILIKLYQIKKKKATLLIKCRLLEYVAPNPLNGVDASEDH